MSSIQVNDPQYQTRLVDPTALLDVPHHDVPDRHVIGGALLSPTTVGKIGGTPSVGKSPAPARADHVHGFDLATFPGSLGRIANGVVLNPGGATNIAAGSATDLTGTLNFTPVNGRWYNVIYVAKAFGPQTGPTDTSLTLRIVGSGGGFLDHWFYSRMSWASIFCRVAFLGDGIAKSWKIQTANVNVACQVYSTDFAIEDIGK